MMIADDSRISRAGINNGYMVRRIVYNSLLTYWNIIIFPQASFPNNVSQKLFQKLQIAFKGLKAERTRST